MMSGDGFNWTEFFNMGGYAFYVWWSYAVFFAVIIGNLVLPITQKKHVIARVKRAIKRESVKRSNA